MNTWRGPGNGAPRCIWGDMPLANQAREVTHLLRRLRITESQEERDRLLTRLNEWGAARNLVEFSFTPEGMLKVECFNRDWKRLPIAVVHMADLIISNRL